MTQSGHCVTALAVRLFNLKYLKFWGGYPPLQAVSRLENGGRSNTSLVAFAKTFAKPLVAMP
jgi:hypothetical protein